MAELERVDGRGADGGADGGVDGDADGLEAVEPDFDWESHCAKAQAVLAADTSKIPTFWQNKYRAQRAKAARNWNDFYKRNATKFFRDRHWTWREFPELLGREGARPGSNLVLLEVGCGVGNFVFPLLAENPAVRIYACDFSARAIDLVKVHELYDAARCTAFVCDLTRDDLAASIPASGVDLLTMVFVLSAIPPEAMPGALRNVASALCPGGTVLFRDYGLYDQAQLRFGPGRRLQDQLYVRQDGTLAFYFDKDWLADRVREAGLEVVDLRYVIGKTVNRKLNLHVHRVFVQGRFRRPAVAATPAEAAST